MRRFAAAMIPGVVLVAALSGCAVPVAAALDEGDANRVVVALDRAGIDAAKEVDPAAEGRFRVTVARDEASRALATMADEQLPRAKSRGLEGATDRGQLVPSLAAEHAQLVAGLSGELERTLGNVDGVLAARVHLNVPTQGGLRDAPLPKATASVLVEHRGTTPPLAPESVQRLVAGGAPGLAPADVVVVFVPHVGHADRSASARSDIARVGPIAVARGSMTALKVALTSLALVVIALAAATLGLYAKLVRLRREHGDAAAPSSPRLATPSARQTRHAPGGLGPQP